MSESNSRRIDTEVLAVASGKGGAGKTLIAASLGYALQRAKHRVLFIDADTATDGLSLFLLGPRGHLLAFKENPESILNEYLRNFLDATPVPLLINRQEAKDHRQTYRAIVSGRDIYGDDASEAFKEAEPSLTRGTFREAIAKLFTTLKNSGEWDYIIVDTRGGFGFNTTDVCALADSMLIVTEPDTTSFYQVRNLMQRVAAAATTMGRKVVKRGVIVNKANEGIEPTAAARSDVMRLDPDKIERAFRRELVDELEIEFRDTHPIPLDFQAVRAYKFQQIPYLFAPASRFSYFTLNAFKDVLRVVSPRWSEENVLAWTELVDEVSAAIEQENQGRLSAARAAESRNKQMVAMGNAYQTAQAELTQASERIKVLEYTLADERKRTDAVISQYSSRSRYAIIFAVMALTGALALGYFIDRTASVYNDQIRVLEGLSGRRS